MARRGFLVRECSDFRGLEVGALLTGHDQLVATQGHLRIGAADRRPRTIGSRRARRGDQLGAPAVTGLSSGPARPALMVLGTASHVGKSLIAAAFCRLLAEAG